MNLKYFLNRIVYPTCIVIVSVVISICVTRYMTLKEIGLIAPQVFNIATEPVELKDFDNRYASFLPDEVAQYIVDISIGARFQGFGPFSTAFPGH